MKRPGSIAISCILFSLVQFGNERAECGTIRPAAIAEPNIASDVLLERYEFRFGHIRR